MKKTEPRYRPGDIVKITSLSHEYYGQLARIYYAAHSNDGTRDVMAAFLHNYPRIVHVFLSEDEIILMERN